MMKKEVNKNISYAQLFINQLVELGVKFACISPGSRSTPLTLAAANNKKLKKYVIADERSSGFFALGLAKSSDSPVLIITTSGTAAAELYPAIIEAYYSRVPLIVCTADRPVKLRNSGANQTINQKYLYANHIRFLKDARLPSLTLSRLKKLKSLSYTAFIISSEQDKGPVHINFPFEKPFEPSIKTGSINKKDLETLHNWKPKLSFGKKNSTQIKVVIPKEIEKADKILITVGPGKFSKEFIEKIKRISNKFSIPVFADALSGLRFNHSKNFFINYDAFLRSENLFKKLRPGIVIHFGRSLTSTVLEEFIGKANLRIIVNEFKDNFNPSLSTSKIIKCEPTNFLINLERLKIKIDQNWLNEIKRIDNKTEAVKHKFFISSGKLSEPKVIFELFRLLPEKTNLFIGNSTPVRDVEFFASSFNKKLNLFFNRGASGIDGITSSALGVAAQSKLPIYLLTGDLSFYHDLNSLWLCKNYKIPLKIILINNNGGGLFNFLPIKKEEIDFKQYFQTPLDLDIKKIAAAFGIKYNQVNSVKDFSSAIKRYKTDVVILEIKTNAEESVQLRKRYWQSAKNYVEN